MPKKRSTRNPDRSQRYGAKSLPSDAQIPGGCTSILSDLTQLIADSRRKAFDEQRRSRREKPSIGLVLCRSADRVQVRLALTTTAGKFGAATYRTALPDETLIQQKLEGLPQSTEEETS